MKKKLLGILAPIVLIISSMPAIAQTGNQPSGNLVYCTDGYIYGAYTQTTSAGKRPSTIYRYLPGSTTIEPIYRFSDAVAEVHIATPEGWVYGTAIQYNSSGEPIASTVFSVKNDGKYYDVINTNNVSTKGIHTSLSFGHDYYNLFCTRTGHERWAGGILFATDIEGNSYDMVRGYQNASELPTSLATFFHTQNEYVVLGGVWTATDFGGSYGKGSIDIFTYQYEQFVQPVNFTGYGGEGLDGEGPVKIVNAHDEGILCYYSAWRRKQRRRNFLHQR